MKITDEKLSAFLDAELAPNEMEVIRLALEVDDNLVMRLAELSQVDQWVLENAEVIDAKPIPQALVDLAQQIDKREKVSPEKSNVIQMSAWKKVTSKINTPMSVAAGVVLAITVGVATMNQQQEQSLSNKHT
jgi:negative regulator of sigma E activity